ncbi:hypothetical protein ACOYR1_05995 [Thalassotalea piscium]
MNKLNKTETKTVSVEISEALLCQLAWAFPSGTNEQKVDFCLRKTVKESQKIEGIIYPEDILPCKSFEHVEVKT